MNMIEKEKCCGCGLCCQFCDALALCEDADGFLYPQKDTSKCADCGKCAEACAFQDPKPHGNAPTAYYAAKHVDDDVRRKSSSGGAFTALSSAILSRGGVVVGAIADADFKIVHTFAETDAELAKMRGSKYSQSDISATYKEILSALTSGREVLFTGTPCQVDAVTAYIKTATQSGIIDKLYTLDLLCHGAASPLLWREHIAALASHGKISSYNFRSKARGWQFMTEEVQYTNGDSDFQSQISQSFLRMYMQNLISRPACYRCRYAAKHRVSDITIGDFWRIEDILPEFEDKLGVSLIAANTQKGCDLLYSAYSQLTLVELDFYRQPTLESPTLKPHTYQDLWSLYHSRGYHAIASKYGKTSAKTMLKYFLSQLGLLSAARCVKNLTRNQLKH